jgi:nucleotide-binding universal stress UspA family protein
MDRSRWIVVGVDFSPAADRALERAAELAAELGAGIAIVHAYEDPLGAPLDANPTPLLNARLEASAALVRARYPQMSVACFVRRGAPWDKLVNVAYDVGAEMIVVGASGEHVDPCAPFLGRVVERVAATSPRSVLVVPRGGPPLELDND